MELDSEDSGNVSATPLRTDRANQTCREVQGRGLLLRQTSGSVLGFLHVGSRAGSPSGRIEGPLRHHHLPPLRLLRLLRSVSCTGNTADSAGASGQSDRV